MISRLQDILNRGLDAMLSDIEDPPCWPDLRAIDEELRDWSANGAEITKIGASRSGRTINAAVLGNGSRTFLGWGYPHPDEPIGSMSLIELGRAKLAGSLAGLDDWRLVLILCADPDNAHLQQWLSLSSGIEGFAASAWRPTHMGVEVDYGFPFDRTPFYQPPDYRGKCRRLTECDRNCGALEHCRNESLPFGPLPESKALLEALSRFRPDIIASMHNTHTSGDYTFLLNREPAPTMRNLTLAPELAGSMRHLGEPIDRGPRFQRGSPDLIRERTVAFHSRRLQRHPSFKPGYEYAGNASASMVIETMLPNSQFVCPETALFRHPDFADSRPCHTQLACKVAIEHKAKGNYFVKRVKSGGEWIVAEQHPVDKPVSPPKVVTKPASRACLGVLALSQRRRALGACDEIWETVRQLPDLADHPYLLERARMHVPGAFVGDRSMLIFRTRPDYRRLASIAQAATFELTWPAHTVSLLANFRNFLAHQDHSKPEIRQAEKQVRLLQSAQIQKLPRNWERFSNPSAAMRSQLARLLCLMLARG